VAQSILGFYDEQELPFFAYLADNYAFCDTFFSAHPGPTLPNRMYSLTSDVQYDRYGFPILENNDGDNFLLSQAPTIYDLLLRNGHDFRVYESFPSVTMLRFFVRYATDTTNIVPLNRLAADVARGDLPAFTAIEPQMHAPPQDDDHPVADMHRGQLFIKRVYDTLTSNKDLWERTLLIITYDEHGGFYDHVIPPVADLYGDPGPVLSSRSTAVTTSAARFGQTTHSPGSTEAFPSADEPLATPKVVTVQYGVRVPTFVVSPWTTPGRGPRLILDHCSILKTVLARFLGAEKPFLSDRVSASHSFEAFLGEAAPRMDVPAFTGSLPDLPLDPAEFVGPSRTTTRITTKPLKRKTMRQGPVDYHEQ
jgi:phospholipase C